MLDLKPWLWKQRFSVRELAARLDMPRKTVEDQV